MKALKNKGVFEEPPKIWIIPIQLDLTVRQTRGMLIMGLIGEMTEI